MNWQKSQGAFISTDISGSLQECLKSRANKRDIEAGKLTHLVIFTNGKFTCDMVSQFAVGKWYPKNGENIVVFCNGTTEKAKNDLIGFYTRCYSGPINIIFKEFTGGAVI